MPRILVTEKIADDGLEKLRAAGHEVDVQLGIAPDDLPDAVRGAHALVIRSATNVTADVVAAGVGLVVIGRAGIGLDNVDVDAATRHGVMVVNAPQSNTVSAAEHTIALLLAQARNIPQAHAALVAGRWERSDWVGAELSDKTLGVIGFGRIGRLVAQRALAFGMRIIAHDPFVSEERARQLSVELVDLDTVIAESDFITLHVAKTPDTIGLIDADRLAGAKPTLRIVNVSRGGIIDEPALFDALSAGTIAGAALDVFTEEPTTESPLFGLPNVVVTPHLGASTREAQHKAGVTIAEQVLLALAGEFVPFAVNVAAAGAAEALQPYLPLAQQLGTLFAELCGELPDAIDVEFMGEIGGYDTQMALLSVQRGVVGVVHDGPVSYVNAAPLAKEMGVEFRATNSPASNRYVNAISIRGGGHSVAGTLAGAMEEPRLVELEGHSVDIPPTRNMVVLGNDDRPGVIGRVGQILGEAGVNIDNMHVGRSAEGEGALMAISVDQPVPEDVLARLAEADGTKSVRALSLEGA